MRARNLAAVLGAALGAVQFILLFYGCGEMETVFPSSGTYRVDALVNDISLESCSIIDRQSAVRPYFASSVTGDPDVRGLTVFLQASGGGTIGGKLHYSLDAVNTENNPFTYTPETPAEIPTEEPAGILPEIPVGLPEKPGEIPVKSLPEEPADILVGLTEEPVESLPEESAEIPVGLPEEPAESLPEEPVDIPVGLPEEPAESLPEGPTETPVGLPEGPGETPPAEKKPPVDEIFVAPRKPPSRTERITRLGPEDRRIPVTRLDADLPPFGLPEDLEIGRYTMVFQVQGERETLYRINKPFYFTADMEFSIIDVQSYLPAASVGTPLIPPGTIVMLEAQVSVDKRLEPYVVWYNGRKRIGEGPVAEGINRLMWKTPDQSGFHQVRAELFPFRPTGSAAGKVKELSLPVSSKRDTVRYFTESGRSFIHWYQLGGDLQDSKVTDNALRPQGNTVPHWLPGAGVYGLVLGADDVYALPGSPFVLKEGEQGRGRVRLRFKPLGAGIILRAAFKAGKSSRNALEMSLSYTGEALRLSVAAGTKTRTVELGPEFFDGEEFIALMIDFSLQGTVFTAALGLEKSAIQSEELRFTLADIFTGEGTVQFGAFRSRNAAGEIGINRGEAAWNGSGPARTATAILDEVSLSYTREPFVPPLEEPLEEESPPPDEEPEEVEGVTVEGAPLPGQAEDSETV